MIKEKLVQLLADSVQEKFAMRTVALHYEQAYNTIVGQIFVQDANQYDFYIKPYRVNVVRQDGEIYALLPAPIIQNVDNAKGVRNVRTLQNDTRFYAAPLYLLDSSSDCTKMHEIYFYGVTHDRIKLDKKLPTAVKKLNVYLVVPFSEWGDKEDISIPGGVADNIMALAMQTLQGKTDNHTNAYKTK